MKNITLKIITMLFIIIYLNNIIINSYWFSKENFFWENYYTYDQSWNKVEKNNNNFLNNIFSKIKWFIYWSSNKIFWEKTIDDTKLIEYYKPKNNQSIDLNSDLLNSNDDLLWDNESLVQTWNLAPSYSERLNNIINDINNFDIIFKKDFINVYCLENTNLYFNQSLKDSNDLTCKCVLDWSCSLNEKVELDTKFDEIKESIFLSKDMDYLNYTYSLYNNIWIKHLMSIYEKNIDIINNEEEVKNALNEKLSFLKRINNVIKNNISFLKSYELYDKKLNLDRLRKIDKNLILENITNPYTYSINNSIPIYRNINDYINVDLWWVTKSSNYYKLNNNSNNNNISDLQKKQLDEIINKTMEWWIDWFDLMINN